MNRPSLPELGVHLPGLAVTIAGALPPTAALREALHAHARAVLSDAELAEEAQRAAEHWIGVQQKVGLDLLVDGNLGNRDLVCRFTDGLAGFTPGGLIRIYGDRYRRKPIIAGPVSWREPVSVQSWSALQALTDRPVKARITGPYSLTHWSFDAHYPSRDAACLAIAAALRQEMNALVAAGARVIQLDEPALAEPSVNWGLAAEALRMVTTGIGAYVMAHTGAGPAAIGLPVDNVDLSDLDLDQLPPDMDATIGVASDKDDLDPSALRDRLEAAVATYGTERLWVGGSWQLAHLTAERAEQYLEALVGAATSARGGSLEPAMAGNGAAAIAAAALAPETEPDESSAAAVPVDAEPTDAGDTAPNLVAIDADEAPEMGADEALADSVVAGADEAPVDPDDTEADEAPADPGVAAADRTPTDPDAADASAAPAELDAAEVDDAPAMLDAVPEPIDAPGDDEPPSGASGLAPPEIDSLPSDPTSEDPEDPDPTREG